MKTYVCKRLRLFNYLTTNGFIPFRQCADFKDNTKYVWLFADSLSSNYISKGVKKWKKKSIYLIL